MLNPKNWADWAKNNSLFQTFLKMKNELGLGFI